MKKSPKHIGRGVFIAGVIGAILFLLPTFAEMFGK
jgi:hypothetical protein